MPDKATHRQLVYLDLTHAGRHVTGLERISIEQFEQVSFTGARIVPVRARGVLSMILCQQLLLPLLALLKPSAQFVFPGFPPSPVFALIPHRVWMYVHDTFLITRKSDLSAKARFYMAPQFACALRHLSRFMVNSEKTREEVRQFVSPSATVMLYRPSVANVFLLSSQGRPERTERPRPLRLAALGTIEPRKNYSAALAILETLRASGDENAQLHIIGRSGWGENAARIADHPGVVIHGYLPADGVKEQLEAADIYLCTSHDEGLGLPLLEAQYAGLAVVAPDAPVFRQVLGTSATFINSADAAGAARAITSLISQPGWRAATTAAALANVARWNEAAAKDLAGARMIFAATDRQANAAAPAPARAP
ncbi:MAG: glycosyltransferase [Hyphomicrobium sp.]|jgi:glycosyltransferase involved in cell wall biosynthesis|nr:glycosyltransferase [Hyphomicrobium sp.]